MASAPRFSIPPLNTSVTAEPVTPEPHHSLRSRSGTRQGHESTPASDSSPTSSTISNLSRILEPARPLYRQLPSSALATPTHKVTIRADPAVFTCFDPADKELYDLWAPKS